MYNNFVWMILVTGHSDWGGIHSNVKSFRMKHLSLLSPVSSPDLHRHAAWWFCTFTNGVRMYFYQKQPSYTKEKWGLEKQQIMKCTPERMCKPNRDKSQCNYDMKPSQRQALEISALVHFIILFELFSNNNNHETAIDQKLMRIIHQAPQGRWT